MGPIVLVQVGTYGRPNCPVMHFFKASKMISVQTNRGYKKPNRNRNNQIHYSVWYEGNRIFQNSIPIPFNRIGIPVF